MTSDERLKRIKEAHARKSTPALADGEFTPTPAQMAAHIARLEAAEIAHGQAIFQRRLADFEAFAKKHPRGSLKRSPSTNGSA